MLFRSKSPVGPPKILIFGESGGTSCPFIKRSGMNFCTLVAERDCPLVYRYYTGFWFREARFDSSVDNKAAALIVIVRTND